jgi:lantibiotic biosynthesis protein
MRAGHGTRCPDRPRNTLPATATVPPESDVRFFSCGTTRAKQTTVKRRFSAEQHNWPDLRSMDMYGAQGNQPVFALAWCHGGPGIGLSRLFAARVLHDEEILRDLDEALATTARTCDSVVFPNSGSLCLCHGLGGNADLLLLAADERGRSDLREIAERIGLAALAQLVTDDVPWPCGVNGCGETPNLMLGLAGIGHFFLRLYDSSSVSSVLLVANSRTEPQEMALSAAELVVAD